jgi:hypothetical protein
MDGQIEERWLTKSKQCWSANVKVPKALLSEARETFEKNPDGGHLITTGSIAVCLSISTFFLQNHSSPESSSTATPSRHMLM